jgi:hypothetical protein
MFKLSLIYSNKGELSSGQSDINMRPKAIKYNKIYDDFRRLLLRRRPGQPKIASTKASASKGRRSSMASPTPM